MRSKEKKKREEMKKQKEWPDWMRKGEKKRRGRTHLNKIRDNNFSTNLFESNPILDAGVSRVGGHRVCKIQGEVYLCEAGTKESQMQLMCTESFFVFR